tara:strand:+ start:399 stop:947 length:549 start_codon:yes stop_codon:yes gene_type:complete
MTALLEQLSFTGPLGLIFLFLSTVGLSLIIERTLFCLRQPATLKSNVLRSLKDTLQQNASKPKAIRDELVEHLLLSQKDYYYKNTHVLRLIAIISPMIGLLGTVLGIIGSFYTISKTTEPVTPALIADGLWLAMLTTAMGLIIALPCLVAAFMFTRFADKRLDYYQHELNKESLAIEGITHD